MIKELFTEVLEKNKDIFLNAVGNLYFLSGRFGEEFNGKQFGFNFQSMLVEFFKKCGVESSLTSERKGQKNDIEERDDEDIIVRGIPISVKTYGKDSFPQLSTSNSPGEKIKNLGYPKTINDKNTINEIFNVFLDKKEEIIIFNTEKNILYYFNKILFVESITEIARSETSKKTEIPYSFFSCVEKDLKAGTIYYQAEDKNPFQRGVWSCKNKKSFSYPYYEQLINFGEAEFDYEKLKKAYINYMFNAVG